MTSPDSFCLFRGNPYLNTAPIIEAGGHLERQSGPNSRMMAQNSLTGCDVVLVRCVLVRCRPYRRITLRLVVLSLPERQRLESCRMVADGVHSRNQSVSLGAGIGSST